MMIVTSKIIVDLMNPSSSEVIHAVQDDQYSRNLEIHLYQNGAAFAIPDSTTAIVSYKKPDGTGGNYDTLPDGSTAYEIAENVVTVKLAPQVLTVPGRVTLSAGLLNDTSKIYTFAVFIDVQANPGLQATSENYYKVIGALPEAGWAPNRYFGTDANGNVVTLEVPAGAIEIDATLRKEGAAADAKVVGDALGNIAAVLDELNGEVV